MLSLSEIRSRAVAFSQRWNGETSEHSEAKIFWHEFFTIFGIDRKRVATFEKHVNKAGNRAGFVDMFWPGVCLVEHKSGGLDLDRAFDQALDYFPGLTDAQLPRYVIVSDFLRIRLHDLVEGSETEITLDELPEKTHLFGFISGYVQRTFRDEDPANIKAAELMGKLHDALKGNGYDEHPLEVFLVRILFCLFADDTGIFPRDSFVAFLESKTREDGIGFGSQIIEFFQILNTPVEKRAKNLDEELAVFPFVNGSLFSESLPVPTFDSTTRLQLLECAYFNWQNVSPAVFGSMFQSVMNDVERRNLGAHYTSAKNILKVISGLFLDELRTTYLAAKDSPSKLRALHERMASMRFLDPACGCGNFLIVTYKELRLLEIDILKRLESLGKGVEKGILLGQYASDMSTLSRLSVHSMYGIEIEEFPARIAETAMWLVDHQMNVKMSEEFGEWWVRLPLTEGPTIYNTDALELDWKPILDREQNKQWYILGNPPFIGSKMMTEDQRKQIKKLFGNVSGSGVLDFVTGWYVKAAQVMQGSTITCAFVSTNSISQGEQVGILWRHLAQKYGVHIHFAHRTFRWSNEARRVAAVHCVIVGIGCSDIDRKHLFDYETITATPIDAVVSGINGYLTEGADIFIHSRPNPIDDVPKMMFGNMPLDGGHLLLTPEERDELLKSTPAASKYVKKVVGAWEFLNNGERYCLWLEGISPSELRAMPAVMTRVEAVKEFRLSSKAPSTQDHAVRPWEFRDTRHPNAPYLIVPRVSSEARPIIPIGFANIDTVTTDSNLMIHDAEIFHFGILSSAMHMSWVRYVCGRLKSDYRYSKDLVYNNYPWPSTTVAQQVDISRLAQDVLDVRTKYTSSSLADLYHPTTMPPDLRKAHQQLDSAVDASYRKQAFKTERERVEYLFELYRTHTEGFAATPVPAKKSRRKKN
ncbi:MAG: DNA methyltransferase [bacterium]|nr:DNA methyltransferase [bacterium]